MFEGSSSSIASATRLVPAYTSSELNPIGFDARLRPTPCMRKARRLYERSGVDFVALHDRISTHVGERLDGECRIEASHRWKRRAADDEQVGDVPTLAEAVHNGSCWISPHARATLVVRPRSARPHAPTPHPCGAHRAAQLFQLARHELDPCNLVLPSPIIGQARRRQAPLIAYVRIEIDHLV